MGIFEALTLIGGLCLFLYGMSIMGEGLERSAGGKLQMLLAQLTTNKFLGFLTGCAVTAVIQSSSATTVMVVGFVNSGLMNLRQAINVIMGANVGTTITGWILSLSGIDDSAGGFILKLLKPSSFTPVLALIGIALYMFSKNTRKKDVGTILLGFAILMFGMDTMSGAVSGLRNDPGFTSILTMFESPLLGILAGTVLTAIIQSSSASVGILQALSSTGAITMGAAVPIIMGQNIGTCVTAVLSCLGANKNAKRAALAHLFFNLIGTVIFITLFYIFRAIFPDHYLFSMTATYISIAIANTVYKVACTVFIMPISGVLEKLTYVFIPKDDEPEKDTILDERLLATPAIALDLCHNQVVDMADAAIGAMKNSLSCFTKYDKTLANSIREAEDITDRYEDIVGTYLVKLSSNQISPRESAEAAKLLKIIGDLERISDHAVGIIKSVEEMETKKLSFSDRAREELDNMTVAINEVLDLTYKAFVYTDLEAAATVEPLEQVIDKIKNAMRNGHIERIQQGVCSIGTGFVWSDILTNLQRTSDHCSNIAGCVIDAEAYNLNLHESLRAAKEDSEYFKVTYKMYKEKYLKV